MWSLQIFAFVRSSNTNCKIISKPIAFLNGSSIHHARYIDKVPLCSGRGHTYWGIIWPVSATVNSNWFSISHKSTGEAPEPLSSLSFMFTTLVNSSVRIPLLAEHTGALGIQFQLNYLHTYSPVVFRLSRSNRYRLSTHDGPTDPIDPHWWTKRSRTGLSTYSSTLFPYPDHWIIPCTDHERWLLEEDSMDSLIFDVRKYDHDELTQSHMSYAIPPHYIHDHASLSNQYICIGINITTVFSFQHTCVTCFPPAPYVDQGLWQKLIMGAVEQLGIVLRLWVP